MPYPLITWCTIINDLKTCFRTRNFSYMLGLLEELQLAGDRMESALCGKKNVKEWEEKRHELNKEIKKLTKKRDELKVEIDDLEGSKSSNENGEIALEKIKRSLIFYKTRVQALVELNNSAYFISEATTSIKTWINNILTKGRVFDGHIS